jgi:hypothetical protein
MRPLMLSQGGLMAWDRRDVCTGALPRHNDRPVFDAESSRDRPVETVVTSGARKRRECGDGPIFVEGSVDDDIKLKDVVTVVDEGGGEPITSRTMLAALMKKFGGMDGFVDKIEKEWNDTPSGSITHRAIMRIFVSLTINASQGDHADEDLENLDDEQLIVELQKTFRLLVKRKADGEEVKQIEE